MRLIKIKLEYIKTRLKKNRIQKIRSKSVSIKLKKIKPQNIKVKFRNMGLKCIKSQKFLIWFFQKIIRLSICNGICLVFRIVIFEIVKRQNVSNFIIYRLKIIDLKYIE